MAGKLRQPILVVDDDEGLRGMLEMVLQSAGYDVLTAGDGYQAWEIACAEAPQLVLLDWMMPGHDGGTLCRRLKSSPQTRTIAVVLLSCDDRLASRAEGFGADAMVLKPFDVNDLLRCVDGVLQQVAEPASAMELAFAA